MSEASGVRGWRGQVGKWWPVPLLAAAALLAGLLAGPRAGEGPPLDPDSTAPAGARALVDVLGELGADVDVVDQVPDAGAEPGTLLLLSDRQGDDEREAVRAWVREGSTVVVADPASPLSPDVVGGTGVGLFDVTVPRVCDLPALADVERVSAPADAVLESTAAEVACFPRGEGHWLVANREGDGVIVALGGASALVNRELANADNSVLAAALLAPEPDGRVLVTRPPLPGEGEATLADLVPPNVHLALVQLAIAFLVVVAWRARRLGRPVREPQAVQIAGSEIVIATGHLLQEAGARDQAARLVADDLRRTLTERLGLPPSADAGVVAEAAAARIGGDVEALRALLLTPSAATDADLVDLAQRVERVRARLLGEDVALSPREGAVRVE